MVYVAGSQPQICDGCQRRCTPYGASYGPHPHLCRTETDARSDFQGDCGVHTEYLHGQSIGSLACFPSTIMGYLRLTQLSKVMARSLPQLSNGVAHLGVEHIGRCGERLHPDRG